MSTPFIAEVRLVSFNFAPKGWAPCDGQFLPINQNQALFSLLGTTYGGDGRVNFALPDLRGRVPLHVGQGLTEGEKAGAEAVTITQGSMPAHNHTLRATTNTATVVSPAPTAMSANGTLPLYAGSGQNLTTLRPDTFTNAGGSQPHTNMQPYTVIFFMIALQGIFPSQT